MDLTPSDADRLMQRRRSIFPKDYTGERVPDEWIKRMIDNATLAPTHKLTEPWHFVVFTGEGLKKLAAFQSECYRQVTQANGTFRDQRYQSLQTKPLECSHVIACGMKRSADEVVPEIEEIGAAFCAIENMYLTAAAYGIGCYLSTGGITYFPEAKSYFGLGPADKLLGFMNIGMPRQWPPASKRKSVTEKYQWIDN